MLHYFGNLNHRQAAQPITLQQAARVMFFCPAYAALSLRTTGKGAECSIGKLILMNICYQHWRLVSPCFHRR